MKSLTQLLILACLLPVLTGTAQAGASNVPPDVATRLLSAMQAAQAAGQPIELLVEYQSATVERAASQLRRERGVTSDDEAVLEMRRQAYARNKAELHGSVPTDSDLTHDYSHLPLEARRFRTAAGLQRLLADPRVRAVTLPTTLHANLAHSLPLIGQPAVAAAGRDGSGTTVAVIDDGLQIGNAAFGCTAPGIPATCRIAVSQTVGSATGGTDTSHGTNVAAIVLGVAPGSRIAFLNAFSGAGASSLDVIAGIDWAIANRATYNIVAINMSLGDGSINTSACASTLSNGFVTPIANAVSAGIAVVAAAGNDARSNSISNPACTPGAISVGAVYSANWGSQSWGNATGGVLCTDSSTAADRIACFSDSASFLTLLAPGSIITAAGISDSGTSQATPHVAGAIAVLRAAAPADTPSQTLSRLTSTGTPVVDPRNRLSKPRLNLQAAVATLPVAATVTGDVPMLPDGMAAALGIALLATALYRRSPQQD